MAKNIRNSGKESVEKIPGERGRRSSGGNKSSSEKEKIKSSQEKGSRTTLEGIIPYLELFRSRLLISLISILAITVISFFFSDELLSIINKPFQEIGLSLNIMRLIDGFLLRVKAAFFTGIVLSFPLIIYQLWGIIAPAIGRHGRWFMRISFVMCVLLFNVGIVLTYLAIPLVVKSLLALTPKEMVNRIDANLYFNFVILFCLSIGVISELPVVIIILTRIGVITPALLSSKRRYIIVIIWVIAAVVTPTVDPFTQTMVALPLMLLFEVSILISKFVAKRKF